MRESRTSSSGRVYPRSRGATPFRQPPPHRVRGLSPLARGNHSRALFFFAVKGSIPARAGQPSFAELAESAERVYPRSRGATGGRDRIDNSVQGLSPLARGNLCSHGLAAWQCGSIPARAGQPGSVAFCLTRCKVYPRSRGATSARIVTMFLVKGLSPLARGNLALDQCL